MKFSNHDRSRLPSACGPKDVAVGYVEQAVQVLSGQVKLGETAEERKATLAKATHILLEMRQLWARRHGGRR